MPVPDAAVYVVGTVELVGGLLLVIGLFVAMLFLLWAGPGVPALDARLGSSGASPALPD